MKKIVAIGGGTGLSTLLRGLRDYPVEITAIVTMTDDGASSGRLRKQSGVLPPGDIRKCIAALSENETGLTDLFEHRFRYGIGLKGHSVGNLFIAAMMEMTGSFELAVERISDLLNIRGRVLPATLEDVHLEAVFDDGNKITGQVRLRKYGYSHKIDQLSLTHRVKTNPRAITAIKEADIILIGPGSLYTSVVPNFLQPGLTMAVAASDAYSVYICNVSTERGETVGYSVSDHITALEKYNITPDAILINNHDFPCGIGDGYVCPVEGGKEVDGHITKIFADVVNPQNHLYHHSSALGKIIYKIITDLRGFEKTRGTGKVYDFSK